MRLLVCNGSPRAGRSNTDVLLDALLSGFTAAGGELVARVHLVRPVEAERAAAAFPSAGALLLAFPLYVDAMPAPAKRFVELLAPCVGRAGNPALLFLVQSGFPEALHSRPVERYLEKLARRLGAPYLGTIVRGGVEGIRSQPAWVNRRLLRRLEALGRSLARDGKLDARAVARLAGRERHGTGPLARVHLAIARAVAERWWASALSRNGALARRDDTPYDARSGA